MMTGWIRNQQQAGLVVLTLSCICAAVLTVSPVLGADHTQDSLATVKERLAQNKAVLIDVREKSEWNSGHLRDARWLPLSELERGVPREKLGALLPPGRIVYLHCAFGARCLDAADLLARQGIEARPLRPGYEALLKAGFPAARP